MKKKYQAILHIRTIITRPTVADKKTRRLGIFSTRDFELLKSFSTLTLLASNKGGLEVSKKVQYTSIAQWAAKLQLVKLGVIFHKV